MGFLLQKKGAELWVVDFNFRMVSPHYNCGCWGDFEISMIKLMRGVGDTSYFSTDIKFKNIILGGFSRNTTFNAQSRYTYESMNNTSRLWKYHKQHFEYKYSDCQEYFL